MDGGRVVFSNALLCYIDQVVRKVAFPHREIVHMIGRERFRLPDFPWECFGDGWYHPPAHLRHAAWNGLKGDSEPQVVDQVNLHNLIMSKTKPLQSRKKSKGSIGDLFFAWGRCSVFGKVMSKFFLPKFGNNTRSWKKEKKGARMTHDPCKVCAFAWTWLKPEQMLHICMYHGCTNIGIRKLGNEIKWYAIHHAEHGPQCVRPHPIIEAQACLAVNRLVRMVWLRILTLMLWPMYLYSICARHTDLRTHRLCLIEVHVASAL